MNEQLKERFKQALIKENTLKWLQEYLIYEGGIRNLNVKVKDYMLRELKKGRGTTPDKFAEQELAKYEKVDNSILE